MRQKSWGLKIWIWRLGKVADSLTVQFDNSGSLVRSLIPQDLSIDLILFIYQNPNIKPWQDDKMAWQCIMTCLWVQSTETCSAAEKFQGLEIIFKYCLSECLTMEEVICCECGTLPPSISPFIVSQYKYSKGFLCWIDILLVLLDTWKFHNKTPF